MPRSPNQSPYELGYRVAALEIEHGTASYVRARERGLFLSSEQLDLERQADWDRGYEHCVIAYQMGLDVKAWVKAGAIGIAFKKPDPRKR